MLRSRQTGGPKGGEIMCLISKVMRKKGTDPVAGPVVIGQGKVVSN